MYSRYLTGVLLLIFSANCIDRLAIGLLLQDIKVDLGLSDTQLGLLTGIAFSIFYAVMGVPIARWADRGSRVRIITITTALFSVAVALLGAVTSFTQLLILRILAAVGESGCQPAALSLLSDYFSRTERPRAIARYWLGLPIALVSGYFIAGWLNELVGWRMTFVFLALPGVILTVVVWLTIAEPPRRADSAEDSENQDGRLLSMTTVLRTLWRNPAYRQLVIGYSLLSFFSIGILQWQPSFFVRSYGLDTGTLGTLLALSYGVTGLIGTWVGGEVATRWAADDERRQLAIVAVVFCLLAVTKTAIYLMPTYQLAFAMLACTSFLAAVTNGPIMAAVQTVVPAPMRATSTALLLLFANLIGAGLGPLAAGMLSDALTQAYEQEALRWVLVILSPGYLLVALHYWLASRCFIAEPRVAPDSARA